jgi:hypothetical protein
VVSRAVPSPTSDDARDELLQALRRTHRATYRYTVHGALPAPEGGTVDGTGTVDPAGRAVQSTIKVTGKNPSTIDRIIVGDDIYIREGGKTVWVHADLDRLREGVLPFFNRADPTGLDTFIASIASAHRTGPRAYAGRFDPHQGSSAFLPIGAPSIISIGMVNAPFTITTDEQGWVTSIAMELTPTDGPKLTMTTTLHDHDRLPGIKPPARSRVVEADDMVYK